MRGKKSAGINSVAFIGLLLVLVLCLLTATAFQRIDTFRNYHKALADHTVSMVANEIIQLIGEKRRLLYLFTRYEQQLIQQLAQDPENHRLLDKMQERVLSYFPDSFAFTLADANGNPLTGDFDERIGTLCREEIIDFSLQSVHHPQIHPNQLQYHYDVMVQLETPRHYIFFVSFQTGSLQNLLRLSSNPNHRLLLLNTETPNLIEVTEQGNRYELKLEDPRLAPEEQRQILSGKSISSTHWRLVDLGDEDLVSAFAMEVQGQAVLVFMAFLLPSVLMMLLIARGNRRRAQAEQALQEAKAQLELDVQQRTRELRASKELAETTLSSISDGVITTNVQGVVTSINQTAEELIGWNRQQAHHCALGDILDLTDEKTGESVGLPQNRNLSVAEIKTLSNRPLRLKRSNGKQAVVQISIAAIRDHKGTNVGNVLVIRDITESHRMNDQISWQATHDNLTGLINRIEFEHRMHTALLHAQSDQAKHALMFIDLDQFKVVNDTCGHIAGDELLRQIAKLLTDTARRTDVVARLGGDEFAILLEYCPAPQAVKIAEELRTRVRELRFFWDGKPFNLGVSIGVVAFDENYKDLNQILSAADSACYLAKAAGRNRVHLYADDDQAIEQRDGEMQWISRIRHALDENRFQLFCQSIVPIQLATPQEEHIEILLRMIEEDGQLVPPGAFIPAAERYGLMVELDRHVIRETLCWLQSREVFGFVSINLSAQSIIDPLFLNDLITLIKSSGHLARMLLFEVTETSTITNLQKAQHFIEQLSDLGCRFALDDFGSGMSSFGYLKHLPVDFLKIDGEFVQDIMCDPIHLSMVKTINEVAHILGMQTIAEYVENEATGKILQSLGIDFVQGYGIARPIPLSDFSQQQRLLSLP
jgi:diguanylate cyclase (GGDEF)-like protein/PAS domain S-box-containing protein